MPNWLFIAVLLGAAAPGATVGIIGATTPVWPAIPMLPAMRPAMVAWAVVGACALVVDRFYQTGRSDVGALSAHSIGGFIGFVAVLVGMAVMLWVTRHARREFELAVAAGEARGPVVGSFGKMLDPGTGAVRVRRGRTELDG